MADEAEAQGNGDDERSDGGDQASRDGGSGAADGLLSALKSKEILIPAAISAVGAVAATAGPGLLKRITQSTEGKGEEEAKRLGRSAAEGAKSSLSGSGGVAGKALSKALGGGSSGGKKTRRLPIQRWTDVAVPVEQAYEAWTKFDQYPQFMHRVVNVKQTGDDKVEWQEKIWFSKRQWQGRITDRRENDRIAWKTTSGMSHKGVVSFHALDDSLTRVMVTLEFEPNGIIEKMASGLRFVKRAVQADLARFKAYVEMEDAEGIEYRAVQKDDDKNEEDDNDGDRQNGDRRGRNRDDASSNDDEDNESRQEERRETVGAS
jgi:uncharacterized membrane protein